MISNDINGIDSSQSSSSSYSENEYEEIGSADTPDLTRVSIYQNPMSDDDPVDTSPQYPEDDVVTAPAITTEDDTNSEMLPQVPIDIIVTPPVVRDVINEAPVPDDDVTTISHDDTASSSHDDATIDSHDYNTSNSNDDITSSDEHDDFDIISIPPPPG